MKSPEDLRVEMMVQLTLNQASEQFRRIDGKNKLALQQELREWLSVEVDDIDVMHMDHFVTGETRRSFWS